VSVAVTLDSGSFLHDYLHTATFRELGPPDLCHIVKNTGRSGQRDVCEFILLSKSQLTDFFFNTTASWARTTSSLA
jgi:hypothetical protein